MKLQLTDNTLGLLGHIIEQHQLIKSFDFDDLLSKKDQDKLKAIFIWNDEAVWEEGIVVGEPAFDFIEETNEFVNAYVLTFVYFCKKDWIKFLTLLKRESDVEFMFFIPADKKYMFTEKEYEILKFYSPFTFEQLMRM